MSLQLPAPSASERRPVAEARPVPPVEPHDGRWHARIWAAASGAVGTVAGVIPHVLHHVGPLVGAAFLTGAVGTAAFGALGLVLSVPLLLRLRRRFHTWWAPAIGLLLFTAMFLLSTFVIGPLISDGPATKSPGNEIEQTDPGHADHHG